MIKIYKCKETFYVEKYDDDGFTTDKQMAIVKGSKWEYDEESQDMIIGNYKKDIHLERIAPKTRMWLEVTKETLNKYFELIKEENKWKEDLFKKIIVPLSKMVTLIAEENPDPDYKGVHIYLKIYDDYGNFDSIDIARVESDRDDNYNIIQTYLYKDIYNEDWTQKFNLDIEEIKEMFENLEKE